MFCFPLLIIWIIFPNEANFYTKLRIFVLKLRYEEGPNIALY